MHKDTLKRTFKISISVLLSLLWLSIFPPVIAADNTRHYYLCQSDKGKSYSDKPCPESQTSQKFELSATSNDQERQRLHKQLEHERKLSAQWQAKRQQDDARSARVSQQLARQQQQQKQRCDQAQLKLQIAQQDLKDVQPKNEMAMRKKYQQQQQKTDLICKSV